ncbi:hypothetical protein POX_e07280 [Penicillium oxalicum]|uniref:hypothetical protein n=1 Tax=Penicillium oxalicum TaxID=69781 RepID=UPI0020B7613C|nr:hypothetical protein POX_e07280 [Penicillium oxalicum]KAI2789250.1 hypothetical protein POX_e07280 [Penicillium oxalicum]
MEMQNIRVVARSPRQQAMAGASDASKLSLSLSWTSRSSTRQRPANRHLWSNSRPRHAHAYTHTHEPRVSTLVDCSSDLQAQLTPNGKSASNRRLGALGHPKTHYSTPVCPMSSTVQISSAKAQDPIMCHSSQPKDKSGRLQWRERGETEERERTARLGEDQSLWREASSDIQSLKDTDTESVHAQERAELPSVPIACESLPSSARRSRPLRSRARPEKLLDSGGSLLSLPLYPRYAYPRPTEDSFPAVREEGEPNIEEPSRRDLQDRYIGVPRRPERTTPRVRTLGLLNREIRVHTPSKAAATITHLAHSDVHLPPLVGRNTRRRSTTACPKFVPQKRAPTVFGMWLVYGLQAPAEEFQLTITTIFFNTLQHWIVRKVRDVLHARARDSSVLAICMWTVDVGKTHSILRDSSTSKPHNNNPAIAWCPRGLKKVACRRILLRDFTGKFVKRGLPNGRSFDGAGKASGPDWPAKRGENALFSKDPHYLRSRWRRVCPCWDDR